MPMRMQRHSAATRKWNAVQWILTGPQQDSSKNYHRNQEHVVSFVFSAWNSEKSSHVIVTDFLNLKQQGCLVNIYIYTWECDI